MGDGGEGGGGSRVLALAWVAPIALILAHAIAVPLRANCDCGMFLAAGRLVLEGKLPFLDIIDTNPPMIMYLSAVPAALERVIPLHITTIFTLLVIAACAASTASLSRLLRRPETGLSPAEANAAALLWAMLSLAIDLDRTFGQRDHLFMLAFYPYLVLRWIRWNGGGAAAAGAAHAAALGLAVGVTACFRPFFVALLLATEAYGLLFRRGSLRSLVSPETAAALLAGAAYGAHFLLLPANAREAIFSRWGPQIVQGYDVWDGTLRRLVRTRHAAFALALGALPLLLRAVAHVRGRADPAPAAASRLAQLVGVVTLVCLAQFILAAKWWPYRSHPAVGGATIVLALLAWPVVLRAPWRRAARVAAFVAIAASPCFLWKGAVLLFGTYEWSATAVAPAVEAHSRPGDAILFLTTHVTPTHPTTVQLDRRPATRYLSLIPLAFAYRGVTPPAAGGPFPYRAAGAQTPEEAQFLAELLEDVARSRPTMIFIPTSSTLPALPRGFRIDEYFAANGLLPRLLEGYRFIGWFDEHEAYVRAS